jgi:iron(III) transport system permease protein
VKAILRTITITTSLIAFALVFSPLAAVFAETGFKANMTAFHGFSVPLRGSLLSGFFSAAAALALGIPFAILVEQSRARLKRTLWAFGLLVLIVPPYMAAEAWIVLFGPMGKISKSIALFLGFGPHPASSIDIARFALPGFSYSSFGVGVIMGGCLFPIAALAVASTLRRTDRRVFEAARLAQGSSGVLRVTRGIFVPSILGSALLVFAITLTEFAVPQVLRVRTVSEAVYECIQEGELGSAASLSIAILPLILAAGITGAIILARARTASLAGLEGEVPRFRGHSPRLINNVRAILAAFCAIAIGLFTPIVALIWLASSAKTPAAVAFGTHRVLRASGFVESLQGAWELAHSDALRTVALAGLAACIATAFAIFLARLTARNGHPWISPLLIAGAAVPAPLVGLGLVTLWNHEHGPKIYGSVIIVLLGWLARFFPVTIFLAQSALSRVPSELENAAALAGRGPWGRFRSVVLPNAAPGLIAAWLATYVLCATEFSATLLVTPPGSQLLAPTVINLMRRGQDSAIAACQILLLAVVALPLIILGAGGLLAMRIQAARERTA